MYCVDDCADTCCVGVIEREARSEEEMTASDCSLSGDEITMMSRGLVVALVWDAAEIDCGLVSGSCCRFGHVTVQPSCIM